MQHVLQKDNFQLSISLYFNVYTCIYFAKKKKPSHFLVTNEKGNDTNLPSIFDVWHEVLVYNREAIIKCPMHSFTVCAMEFAVFPISVCPDAGQCKPRMRDPIKFENYIL